MSVQKQDILKWSPHQTYDIVIANVLTEVIEKVLTKLLSLLNQSGRLILSGISDNWLKSIETLITTQLNLANSQDSKADYSYTVEAKNGWGCFLITKH